MRICIIRHGETDWNAEGRFQGREDIPLNAAGLEQARACAQVLQGEGWARVLTSPLCRARRTAREIADVLGVPQVEVDWDLVERDLGAASGMTRSERNRAFPNGVYPGMEALEGVQARMQRALDRCLAQGKDAILISHGAAIRALLEALTGDSMKGVRLHNGGMSLLQDRQLLLWNITPQEYRAGRMFPVPRPAQHFIKGEKA